MAEQELKDTYAMAARPRGIRSARETAIKGLRIAISAAIRQAEGLAEQMDCDPGSEDISMSIVKLKEAKHWAGEALGKLGHRLPEEYRDEV